MRCPIGNIPEDGSYEQRVMKLPVGARCCTCREESVEKVVTTLANFTLGTAWHLAAESRWIHVTRLLLRFLLSSIGKRSLPRALSDLQVHYKLDMSMEAVLSRLVAASANDWSSRSKLRLLRMVRVLCPQEAPSFVAVHLAGVRHLDQIMFAALGDKTTKRPLPQSRTFVVWTAQSSQR